MARYAYEVIGPAAANGWQRGGQDAHLTTAAAAWHVVAQIAKRTDPEFADSLRQRTTDGTVDHDGTRFMVMRIA